MNIADIIKYAKTRKTGRSGNSVVAGSQRNGELPRGDIKRSWRKWEESGKDENKS